MGCNGKKAQKTNNQIRIINIVHITKFFIHGTTLNNNKHTRNTLKLRYGSHIKGKLVQSHTTELVTVFPEHYKTATN